MEYAPIEWTGSRVAVHRDSVELDAKQVSLQPQWNPHERKCEEGRTGLYSRDA